MSTDYIYIANLIQEAEIPSEGILSRPLHEDDQLKVVLFSFSAGQELSEHTASRPAVLHFVQGEAQVTLGSDTHDVKPGAWVHMVPGLKHGIKAKTPVVLLLLLLK